jgi:hypothetical protein
MTSKARTRQGACARGFPPIHLPERQLNSGSDPSDPDFVKQRNGVEKRPSTKPLLENSSRKELDRWKRTIRLP